MTTGNFVRTSLYKIHNVVQNTMIVVPKELIIATLKDFFSHDDYYHFVKDDWGFTKTVDETGFPLGAGLHDNSTTRVFVGENYRFDGIFYPAVLVKHGGIKYVPISINREKGVTKWGIRAFEDGYGNFTFFRNPDAFVFAGAWEGSLIVDVITRSLRARDDLIELVSICLTDITFSSLEKAGVIVKPLTVGAPFEQDDRNDKLFRTSITIDIRCEWRREIPISNILEVINFAIEFVDLAVPNAPVAQNLTINTRTGLFATVPQIMAAI